MYMVMSKGDRGQGTYFNVLEGPRTETFADGTEFENVRKLPPKTLP